MTDSFIQVFSKEHDLINQFLVILQAETKNMESGENINVTFYEKVIDFIENYIFGLHDIKEEKVLFDELVRYEKEKYNPQIRRFIHQHTIGYHFIEKLKKSYSQGKKKTLIKVTREFTDYMLDHVDVEDTVAFPLFEKYIPFDLNKKIVKRLKEVDQNYSIPDAQMKYENVCKELKNMIDIDDFSRTSA